MAQQQDPRVRNIKIKTGVLKRLIKEKAMYEKEVIEQTAKVEKMKTNNEDQYDIRKQQEVLEESKMMIPDSTKRIRTAYADLKNCLESSKEEQEHEEYTVAAALIEVVSPNV